MAVVGLVLLAAGCGDREGAWPRYKVEKALYEARQAVASAQLSAEAGQTPDREALAGQLEKALSGFDALRPRLGPGDSTLLAQAAELRMQRAGLRAADTAWEAAARDYRTLAEDTLTPASYRNLARMQLGGILERLGRFDEAAAEYRRLLDDFWPPRVEKGVNTQVLNLPRRLVAMAEQKLPDSLSAWRSFGEAYYDSLARTFPHSALAAAALGELGRMYASDEDWPRVISTLERATDTAGNIAPAYWIDIAEIAVGHLHDTARALTILEAVAAAYPDSPFGADAELKRARIWLRRGRYDAVRTATQGIMKRFEDRPAAFVPARLLYAQSFAEAGDWERARAEFSYLITNYPRTLQAVTGALILARHFGEAGNRGERDLWFRRADSLAAGLLATGGASAGLAAATMNLRVSIALEQERWDDAAARFGDIVQAFSPRAPAGALALVRLGWLHLRQRGDTAAAGAAWQRFLEAHPDHPLADSLRSEMSKWPNHPSPGL